MNLVEKIAEDMLEQGLRELLYAFRKNGGSLDYCVKQIREDFKKAAYYSILVVGGGW